MGKKGIAKRKKREEQRTHEKKKRIEKQQSKEVAIEVNYRGKQKDDRIYKEEIDEFKIKRRIGIENNIKITDEAAKEEIKKTQKSRRDDFTKGILFSSPNERRQVKEKTGIDIKQERKMAEKLEGERRLTYLNAVLKKLEEANRQDDQEER